MTKLQQKAGQASSGKDEGRKPESQKRLRDKLLEVKEKVSPESQTATLASLKKDSAGQNSSNAQRQHVGRPSAHSSQLPLADAAESPEDQRTLLLQRREKGRKPIRQAKQAETSLKAAKSNRPVSAQSPSHADEIRSTAANIENHARHVQPSTEDLPSLTVKQSKGNLCDIPPREAVHDYGAGKQELLLLRLQRMLHLKGGGEPQIMCQLRSRCHPRGSPHQRTLSLTLLPWTSPVLSVVRLILKTCSWISRS